MGSEVIATRPSSGSMIRFLANQTAADVSDGERKTVTALFADIKGSTELMADLDPEEARSIVDPALKLMIDAFIATMIMSCSLRVTGSLPFSEPRLHMRTTPSVRYMPRLGCRTNYVFTRPSW
jgi:hypothetical protein